MQYLNWSYIEIETWHKAPVCDADWLVWWRTKNQKSRTRATSGHSRMKGMSSKSFILLKKRGVYYYRVSNPRYYTTSPTWSSTAISKESTSMVWQWNITFSDKPPSQTCQSVLGENFLAWKGLSNCSPTRCSTSPTRNLSQPQRYLWWWDTTGRYTYRLSTS